MLLLPYLKSEAELLQKAASQPAGTAERQAGDKLQTLILRYLPPILLLARSPPDNMDEYKDDYGLLGSALCERVFQLRTQQQQTQKQRERQQKVQPVNWTMPLLDQVKQLKQKQEQQPHRVSDQGQTEQTKLQTQPITASSIGLTAQQKTQTATNTAIVTPPTTLSTINLSDLS